VVQLEVVLSQELPSFDFPVAVKLALLVSAVLLLSEDANPFAYSAVLLSQSIPFFFLHIVFFFVHMIVPFSSDLSLFQAVKVFSSEVSGKVAKVLGQLSLVEERVHAMFSLWAEEDLEIFSSGVDWELALGKCSGELEVQAAEKKLAVKVSEAFVRSEKLVGGSVLVGALIEAEDSAWFEVE